MVQITRLGVSGIPRQLYGSFVDKGDVASTINSFISDIGDIVFVLPQTVITTALTGDTTDTNIIRIPDEVVTISVAFIFRFGTGGTDIKAYLQSSLDGGTNWHDICSWSGASFDEFKLFNIRKGTSVTSIYTPDDGTLVLNSVKDGLIGDRLRVKLTTTGTYGGNTRLSVNCGLGMHDRYPLSEGLGGQIGIR